jgi:hypothetical protein
MGPAHFVEEKLITRNNVTYQHTEKLSPTEMVGKEVILYFCVCSRTQFLYFYGIMFSKKLFLVKYEQSLSLNTSKVF